MNPEEAIVVVVAGTFKPTVFDRIDLIQKHIDPFLADKVQKDKSVVYGGKNCE